MKGARWAMVGVLFLAFPAFAWSIGGGLGVGLVSMTYLNSQLEALASRQGVPFSSLFLAWEGRLDLWPWSFLGITAEWLGCTGGIGGRDPQPLSATAIGIGASGRIFLPVFNWKVGVRAGLGGYWAAASGVVAGQGLAFGGQASLEWAVFSWGPLQGSAYFAFRHLQVPSIRNERETISPLLVPALDFSGMSFGIMVEWRW